MKSIVTDLLSSYEIFLKGIEVKPQKNLEQKSVLSFFFSLPASSIKEDFLSSIENFQSVFYSVTQQEEFLGVGKIVSFWSEGSDRWKTVEEKINEFSCAWTNDVENRFSDTPLFLSAIKFYERSTGDEWSNFKNLEFYIPELLVEKRKSELIVRYNRVVEHGDTTASLLNNFEDVLKNFLPLNGHNFPLEHENDIVIHEKSSERERWNKIISAALAKIEGNDALTKVVLARRVACELEAPLSSSLLLQRLKKANPLSNIFYVKNGSSVFLGSSPEILIEFKENILHTEAIAGSRKRGETAELDFELEQELLASIKEINEHKSVVDFLISNLEIFSSGINYASTPTVKKLATIQHLSTGITATLKSGVSLLNVVETIFPTPAVCGNPKSEALTLIEELEDFDRGLYGGLVGWYSATAAKLIVAIRSTLINKKNIYLYAGCGIVEGSNPESEFNETEIKLRTILSAFNEKH